MSEILNELKTDKRKKLDYFFSQEIKMSSKKSFHFKNVINDDLVILLTTNIRTVKNKRILVTGEHTGIFLKDWQFIKLNNHQRGINCYAVKLYRKYFKPFNFGNISFYPGKPEINDFEEAIARAKKQEEEHISFTEGWNDFA